MSEQKETNNGQQPTIINSVSDNTGEDDPQFMLWRAFCSVNSIEVNLLVSQSDDEQREKWNELKRVLLKRESN